MSRMSSACASRLVPLKDAYLVMRLPVRGSVPASYFSSHDCSPRRRMCPLICYPPLSSVTRAALTKSPSAPQPYQLDLANGAHPARWTERHPSRLQVSNLRLGRH